MYCYEIDIKCSLLTIPCHYCILVTVVNTSLGKAPVVEIRCCPKTSKDANGSTRTIDIR